MVRFVRERGPPAIQLKEDPEEMQTARNQRRSKNNYKTTERASLRREDIDDNEQGELFGG